MNVFSAMEILSTALTSQRTRMNTTASNLANATTTRTPEGGPYKRRDVVFSATPTGSPFEDFLNGTHGAQLRKLRLSTFMKTPMSLVLFLIQRTLTQMAKATWPCQTFRS